MSFESEDQSFVAVTQSVGGMASSPPVARPRDRSRPTFETNALVKLNNAMAENKKLKQEIKELKEGVEKRQEEQLQELEEEKEVQARQLTEKDKEIEELRREKEQLAVEQEERVLQLQQESEQQQKQKEQELLAKDMELSSLKKDLDSSKKQCAQESASVREQLDYIEGLTISLDDKEAELSSLRTLYDELTARYDQATSHNQQLQKSIQQLQELLQEVGGQKREQEQKIQFLRSDSDQHVKQLRAAQEAAERGRNDFMRLQEENRQLQHQNTEKDQKIVQLEQEKNGAEEKCQVMDIQLKTFTEDFDSERAARERAIQEKMTLAKRNQELKSEVQQLRQRLNLQARQLLPSLQENEPEQFSNGHVPQWSPPPHQPGPPIVRARASDSQPPPIRTRPQHPTPQ